MYRGGLVGSALAIVLTVAWVSPAFAADAYEPDGTAGTGNYITAANDVASTSMQLHTFSDGSDVDWVRFKPKYDTTVHVKIYNQSLSDRNCWVKYKVYRLKGTKWVAVTGEHTNMDDMTDSIELYVGFKTTYAVRIRPYQPAGAAGKSYYVRVLKQNSAPTVTDSFEPGDNTKAGAHVLSSQFGVREADWLDNDMVRFDRAIRGAELHNIYNPIGTYDDDWYQLNLVSGRPNLLVFYTGIDVNRKMEIDLVRADGSIIDSNTLGAGVYFWWRFPEGWSEPIWAHVRAKDSGTGIKPYWYRVAVLVQ